MHNLRHIPWHACLPLLFLLCLPLTDGMALISCGLSYRCLTYPLAHAGIMHLIVNSICWLPMTRIITPRRLAVAYLCSVSFGCFLPVDRPVCGWSVILFFFVGLTFRHRHLADSLPLVITLAASLFIPGIAAWFHIASLACGVLYSFFKRR